jgi:hypothetical protein
MHAGYDVFHTTPGKVIELLCRVCGTKCNVKRDVYEPDNFGMALAQKADLFDTFICPNTEMEWHKKAMELLMAIKKTPSKRLVELMRLDLMDLLKENGVL